MVRFSLCIALALCLGATALASVIPDYTNPEGWLNNFDGKKKKNNIAVVQIETNVSPSGKHTVHVNGQKMADHDREQLVDLDKTVRTGNSADEHNDHKKANQHGSGKNNIAVVQVKTKVNGKDGKNNIAVVQVKTNVLSSPESLVHKEHTSDLKHSVRTAADGKEAKKLLDIADEHLKGKKNNIAVVQVQTVVHTYKHNDHGKSSGKNNIAVVQVDTKVGGDQPHGSDNNIAVVQVVTKVHPGSYDNKKIGHKDEKEYKEEHKKEEHKKEEHKKEEHKKEEHKKEEHKKEEHKVHKY